MKRVYFLCLGGALGGAIVSLYQNGGYDEPLQMRLARSPQRSLHRPDLFPHTPAYDHYLYTSQNRLALFGGNHRLVLTVCATLAAE